MNAQEAAVTIRSALQTINPALSKKLPASVLDATATISQSDTVDLLFRSSRWVEDLYLPSFLLGVGIFILAMVKARERVRAIRTVGVTLAVAGGLLLGIGFATPAFAAVAATADPLRGDAVAVFIQVLTGRLVAAGQAFFVFGILLALAPGHDGGDLRHRVTRIRAWFAEKRTRPRWRFVGGVALMALALVVVTKPTTVAHWTLLVAAGLALYVGIVICLRASGLLETDHAIPKLHKRQLAGVFAALVVSSLLTATLAVQLVASATSEPRANPTNQGCNGFIELCAQPLNQIVWPASHNAMSSAAYNFLGAEHTITIPEQMNAGARFFMIDAYYGYEDDGLVRTNLAGGANREELRKDRGDEAVRELDRLGALTGVADTSGEKQDLYFCHDFCELGAVPASQIFADIDAFLSRNLTDVVVIDVEDYVQPKDLKAALIDAGLFDRVWRPSPKQFGWPSLRSMVIPANEDAKENPRRLIVMSEKHPGVYPWLLGAYDVSQETPFTYTSIPQFTCKANRGGDDKSFFIVNHWLRPDGPPDPVAAGKVNSQKTLTARLQDCIATRGQLPNAVAVDFTAVGDLYKTVNRSTRRSRASQGDADHQRDHPAAARPRQVHRRRGNELRRLPKISEAKARRLLGPLADAVPTPATLKDYANPCAPGHVRAPTASTGEATGAAETPLDKRPSTRSERRGPDHHHGPGPVRGCALTRGTQTFGIGGAARGSGARPPG